VCRYPSFDGIDLFLVGSDDRLPEHLVDDFESEFAVIIVLDINLSVLLRRTYIKYCVVQVTMCYYNDKSYVSNNLLI